MINNIMKKYKLGVKLTKDKRNTCIWIEKINVRIKFLTFDKVVRYIKCEDSISVMARTI